MSLYWSRQLRYGERTARGNVGGYKYCWALVLGKRREMRNSKRSMVSRDVVRGIAPSRVSARSAPDRRKERSVTRRVEVAVVLRQGIRRAEGNDWQRNAPRLSCLRMTHRQYCKADGKINRAHTIALHNAFSQEEVGSRVCIRWCAVCTHHRTQNAKSAD